MGWASNYIQALQRGETVAFRPRGHSMTPYVMSGDLVTVVPATVTEVEVGWIVLCVVKGAEYLHFVSATDGKRAQISNAKKHINGWTTRVFGRVIKVERNTSP